MVRDDSREGRTSSRTKDVAGFRYLLPRERPPGRGEVRPGNRARASPCSSCSERPLPAPASTRRKVGFTLARGAWPFARREGRRRPGRESPPGLEGRAVRLAALVRAARAAPGGRPCAPRATRAAARRGGPDGRARGEGLRAGGRERSRQVDGPLRAPLGGQPSPRPGARGGSAARDHTSGRPPPPAHSGHSRNGGDSRLPERSRPPATRSGCARPGP